MTQVPPDNIQDEALSGANDTQNTTPITVPAMVKVRNMLFFFLFCYIALMFKLANLTLTLN